MGEYSQCGSEFVVRAVVVRVMEKIEYGQFVAFFVFGSPWMEIVGRHPTSVVQETRYR
jgi:hypothetical protein